MDVEVRHELPSEDRERLAALYADTWFGESRSGDRLDRMLEGTDAKVALYDDGTLVTFGHAVSDGAFVALVRDVVVAEAYRGRGLGRRLLDEFRQHPALADVETISVVCPERLAGFYEASGFVDREGAVVLELERTDGADGRGPASL